MMATLVMLTMVGVVMTVTGGPKPIPAKLYRCEFRGPSEGSVLLTSGKGELSLAPGSAAAWVWFKGQDRGDGSRSGSGGRLHTS